MPALTKAQKKQAEGTESSFHRVYAGQYGEDRWNETLLPALAAPTRYALLVNRFANEGGEGTIPENVIAKDRTSSSDSETGGFVRIDFPTPKSSSTGGEEREKNNQPLQAYQRGPISIISPTAHQQTTETTEQQSQQQSEESKPSANTTTPQIPFPPPQPSSSSSSSSPPLLTHWNLDAASLLAATALNPLPSDKILDLCAAPGGKSLALAQFLLLHSPPSSSAVPTFHPSSCLHSNEPNPQRNKRLESNLRSYLPPHLFQEGKIKILKFDGSLSGASSGVGRGLTTRNHTAAGPVLGGEGGGYYDKVLLDAPCSSERHLIHSSSSSSSSAALGGWKSTHARQASKTQVGLLMTALRCVRNNGGRVVYATCALGKEENDGVIGKVVGEMVPKEMKKSKATNKWGVKVLGEGEVWDDDGERKINIGKWAERTEFGWIVLPDHGDRNNHDGEKGWGPLYFAVLEKVAV